MDSQSNNSISASQNRVHPKLEAQNIPVFEATSIALNQSLQLPTTHDCRICIQSDNNLIRPCRCTGSAAYVHFQCLRTWINKKSADKDGIVRQLQRIDCEMCKYTLRCNTKTDRTLSCQEYSRIDTCRIDVIMEVFFMAFFIFGTIVIAGILSTRIEKDIADYQNGYSFSAMSICLMTSMPLTAIVGIVLVASFARKHCYRRERVIISFEEYNGTERRLSSNNNLMAHGQSL